MRTKKLASGLIAILLVAGCAKASDEWDAWTPDVGPETTDTGWDPGTDPGWDPGLDTGWDPGTDTGTDPGTDTGTDPGTDCPESPCGLLPNCGCPAGQKCYTNTTTTPTFTRECTTAGSGTSSSLCTMESSCAIETQCIQLFGDSTSPESMCYDFCNSETDCPGDASVCLSYYTTETYPKVCSHSCSPITNSGCPAGTKCQLLILTATDQDLTDCTADLGYTSAGGFCTVEEDCAAGTFCATTINECIQMCSWPSGTECSYLETCTPFEDDLGAYITLDGVTYGYCV